MLAWIIFIPLLTILPILFTKPNSTSSEFNNYNHSISLALKGSLLTLIVSIIILVANFSTGTSEFQLIQTFGTLPLTNIEFIIGVDGISMVFIILTTFIMPFCILLGWNYDESVSTLYAVGMLVLESILILVFLAIDLMFFYIVFEAVLIPMFILIIVYSTSSTKLKAAYLLFLYTLMGSLLMLVGILYIYSETGTTDLQLLYNYDFSHKAQILLWLAFFASFAVKVPMVPLHIWLPEAHVQSPTSGSIILAGLLLKLGTYGLLRFSIPLFPYASVYFTPLVYTMSVIAIIYTSLTTLRQIHMKRIIAYASVGHMNFVTLGIFSGTVQGIEGAIYVMISHGLVSSALFYCIGVLYARHHSYYLKYYRGLTIAMPLFSIVFLILTLANISVPGTSSFVGEFLILTGTFNSNTTITLLGATGIVLGASYSIWLYNRVFFGTLSGYIRSYSDINIKEGSVLIIFVVLIVILGIYPEPVLNQIHSTVKHLAYL